jgi:hypothetical protein
MPPQQPDRLLDLFNEAFDFGAHGLSDLRRWAAVTNAARDVAADAAKRNRGWFGLAAFLMNREPAAASLKKRASKVRRCRSA